MTPRDLVVVALCVAASSLSLSAQEIAVGGRVMVAAGQPLSEAEVRLLPLRDSLSEAADVLDASVVEPLARTLTDTDGRFRLLAPGAGLYRLRVAAPGFVDLEAELVPLIEPRELPDAELRADEGLTLRVVDGEGRSVSGAAVRVATDRSRFAFDAPLWQVPARRGVTEADGTARLQRATGERVLVSVLATGHPYFERSGLSGNAARLRLGAGSRLELALQGSDGKPVAGALAVVEQHPVGRTDARGRLALHAETGKSRTLRFLAEDGRRVETRVVGDAAKAEPRVIVLPDRLAVSGRLIDARTRRGIEGALVWDRNDPMGAVRADRAGGFALKGPAGRILEITAGAPGYMNARSRSFQLSDDGRPGPTLVLEPAAAIEGTVVDEAGAPVAGASVELSEKRASGSIRIEIGGPPDDSPRALTNAKGQFRLGPVDPQKNFDVEARAEGFAPTKTVVRDLEPYRTRSGVRIQLARGQTLIGRVVDLDGRPLAGASLSAAKAKPNSGPGMLHVMSGGSPPSFDGTSGDDGRFEIRGIPAGRYDLEAARSGFAKTTVPAVELKTGDEPLDLGDIALEPGERLQGLVADPDGRPVEGVEVHVSAGGPTMMMVVGPGGGPAEEPDALTDPGGFFQVDDLRKGEPYNLSLRRRGYVEGRLSAVELPRPELVEVTLQPASDVSGRVLDSEGEPIVGAQVNLSRSTTIEMGGMAMQTMMMMSEQTDATGRFLFEDQRPGTISLAAVASGWQETKRQDLEIPQGEDLEVDLPLKPGSVVEGQVFAPDGRPAIGASVSRVTEGPRQMARLGGAPTDGNGYFRLEGLEPGKVSIEATHPDYPRVVRDVELDEGINPLTLHFEGGQEVSGVVLDLAGNAVPGATVSLVPVGRYFGGPETVARGDGTFTMPGVQDGEYSLRADAEGYAESREGGTITVAGEPLAGLEVRLDRGATIVGQVVGLSPEEFKKVGVSARGDLFLGGNSTPVDFEGRFRIENVPAGTYTVVGSVAQSGRQAREKVVVEPGSTEVPVQLQFGGGLTLSGRAVQGERPIGNATVFTRGVDVDHEGWSETDLDGRFRIDGLQPGRYRVQLQNWQTGLSYKEEVDVATSREIELRVPTAQVRGTVVDAADRQPLAGVTVTLESVEPDPQSWRPTRTASTDMDGRFTLDAVGNGAWKLAATRQGYAAATRAVTVQFERDAEDLRLALEPTEGLTLEVRLPTGGIPEELQVAVLEPSGGALTSGTFATGENGRLRLSTVPAGTWELIVVGAGSATTHVNANAPGPPIPVQLQPACSLLVRVPELQSGDGVAQVSLRDASGRAFRGLSWHGAPRAEWRMTDGRIDFRSLPPGSWTVDVAALDGRSWQATTSVAPGAPAELVLE